MYVISENRFFEIEGKNQKILIFEAEKALSLTYTYG